jgi:hypothetical protein
MWVFGPYFVSPLAWATFSKKWATFSNHLVTLSGSLICLWVRRTLVELNLGGRQWSTFTKMDNWSTAFTHIYA